MQARFGKKEWKKFCCKIDSNEVPEMGEFLQLYHCIMNYTEKQVHAFFETEDACWLLERMARKFELWIGSVLMELSDTQPCECVELYTSGVYHALHYFPKELERIVTLSELASVRRDAHTRAGISAVAYLHTENSELRQSNQRMLGEALLAEVPLSAVGNPPDVMCHEAKKVCASFYVGRICNRMTSTDCMERIRQEFAVLNNVLNSLL